ncbi:MAG: hypothetical protein GX053_02080 [Tissierella sp.]|nr:hypothetical protein [Tissierella sp.]
MEDKLYDLMEKMYIEVQGLKSEMELMKSTMATKDDLKNFSTKDDLKNFATKDDLKNLATKDDIDLLGVELHTEIQAVHDEVSELRSDLSTIEILTTKNAFDIAKLKAVK